MQLFFKGFVLFAFGPLGFSLLLLSGYRSLPERLPRKVPLCSLATLISRVATRSPAIPCLCSFRISGKRRGNPQSGSGVERFGKEGTRKRGFCSESLDPPPLVFTFGKNLGCLACVASKKGQGLHALGFIRQRIAVLAKGISRDLKPRGASNRNPLALTRRVKARKERKEATQKEVFGDFLKIKPMTKSEEERL